jgi:hypothetical protein
MITLEPITVWQALSILGKSRDGVCMSEQRCRKVLRQIGMKKHEMDQPYPNESFSELCYLLENPDKLDKTVEEASEWMVSRN